jgi:hypothetical protein
MSAIWSDPKNIQSVNNVATSVHCRSLTFVSPGAITAPPIVNPYHHYMPNYHIGRHCSAGKDSSTLDIKMAAKMASHCKTHNLIDAFMKTGNLEQQRYSLRKFLTHKRIIDDTKHVLQHVKLDKEATAGLHVIHSIKRILESIFKSSYVGRISNQQRAWVNILSACLFSGTNNMDVSACTVGKQAGLSTKMIRSYSSRSLEKALLINSGVKKGYELIVSDQDRTKYSDNERDASEEWLLTDCDFVIENPLKNDAIGKRDPKGNAVCWIDNKLFQIQKRLLMSSYHELHLYMIDNYNGILNDEGNIRFSENTHSTSSHAKAYQKSR